MVFTQKGFQVSQTVKEKHGLALLKEGLPLDLISKHRNALFGISILWIVIFHSHGYGVWLGSLGKMNIINLLVLYGNVGVDIFLLLSGMGLYFSFKKNEQIIPFIKRRLIRVLPPVFIIWGVVWGVRFLILTPSLQAFLQRILLMRFWLKNDGQIWFVNFILVLYLLYPIIYHYLFDKKHALARVLIAIGCVFVFNFALQYAYPAFWRYAEIAFTRIPITLFGCYLGKMIYEKKKLPAFLSLIICAGIPLLFYLRFFTVLNGPLHVIWLRTMLGLGGLLLAYLFAIILELLGTGRIAKIVTIALSFFGWMSLELYLSHFAMKNVYTIYFMKDGAHLSGYFASAAIAIVIAVLVRFALDKVPILFRKVIPVHSVTK